MDKNTIIGFVLIALVLIGFSYYSQRQAAEQRPQQQEQSQAAKSQQPQDKTAEAQQKAAKTEDAAADSTDIFPKSAAAAATAPVVLQNDSLQVKVSPQGGIISEVNLKHYRSYKDFVARRNTMLNLFDANTASLNYQLQTQAGVKNTEAYTFVPENATDSTVTMKLEAKDGSCLRIDYHLLGGTFIVNTTVRASGPAFTGKKLGIQWRDNVRQLEKGYKFEHDRTALTYKETGGDTELVGDTKDADERPEGSVDWVAFKNQYFSAVMIAGKGTFNVAELKSTSLPKDGGFIKAYYADMETALDPSGKVATEMQFYFGPNKYLYLQKQEQYRLDKGKELELEKLIYLGWPIVKWVNRFFTVYVFDFLTGWGIPMGVVLLLITLLLRIIVYPTTRKSYLSSAKMRVLKPKIDALNEKYPKPEDAMKKQQEMMTLYSQYGVNPMGGCLPMLIQMPIWIAMFNFVPNAIELRQQSFLWAEDLSAYDSVGFLDWAPKSIWGIGDHLSLFCLLFCGTNVLYSWLMMRQQKETMSQEQNQQMKIMQWMMFLMPVFFFFMFNEYSSGLNYYYFISLLFSALTMWYLRRSTDDAKLLAKLEANYKANKSNPNRKPGGLAARLEALQKQQEELQKRQQNLGKRKP